MKQLFTLLIAMVLPITTSSQTLYRPSKYVYGCYGLESYPNKDAYQKYVGKVFTFMPASPMLHEEEWLDFAGKPGGKYEIVKISTNDEGTREMDVLVFYKAIKDDGTKSSKVYKKTIFNYNKETSIWQTPFVFMDDVNEEIQESIGKTFTRDEMENNFEIIDAKFETLYETDKHPSIVYYVKDSFTGKTIRMSYMDKGYTNLDEMLLEQQNYAKLVRVECSRNNKTMEGLITQDPNKPLLYQYSDSLFDIKMVAFGSKEYMPPYSLVLHGYYSEKKYDEERNSSNAFRFELKNKTDKTIKIIWDEAVYVDFYGQTSSIIHTGTKFSKMEESQVPSTIIRGASLSDVIIPKDNIKYEEWSEPGRYLGYGLRAPSTTHGEWVAHPLYNNGMLIDEPLTLRLMLPIQIMDEKIEYVLEYQVAAEYTNPDIVLKKGL